MAASTAVESTTPMRAPTLKEQEKAEEIKEKAKERTKKAKGKYTAKALAIRVGTAEAGMNCLALSAINLLTS